MTFRDSVWPLEVSKELSQARRQQQSRYVLFKLREIKRSSELLKHLPKDSRTLGVAGKYVLVKLPRFLASSETKLFDKIPNVQKVTFGKQLQFQEAQCAAPTNPSQDGESLQKLNSELCKLTECSLVARCNDRQESEKLWAQRAVDAQFLKRFAEKRGVKAGDVKVAVVDSGFDQKGNGTQMHPGFQVKAGFDEAGDLNLDEGGHGTAVAGVIGAKDGIGVAPHAELTVYRATSQLGEQGQFTDTAAKLFVMKACEDGNTIINASWGSVSVESGAESDQIFTPDFINELADKGCLVVKAAGNSAYRQEKSSDLDDAVLNVSATESRGISATFSSHGELSAPGENVFSLHSTSISIKEGGKRINEAFSAIYRSCGDEKNGRFIDGTSFAAPITAGIAAETQAILKKSENYSQLAPRDRIKLLNRVLKASTYSGSISGARAAVIAANWVDQNSNVIPSVDRLIQMLDQPSMEECKELNPISMNLGCAEMRESFHNQSLKLKICPSHSLDLETNLIDVALSSGERDIATQEYRGFAERAPRTPEAKRLVSRYGQRVFYEYLGLWGAPDYSQKKSRTKPLSDFDLKRPYETSIRSIVLNNMDFESAIDLLPYYFESRPESKESNREIQQALDYFLNSNSLPQRIYWRLGSARASGTESDKSKILNVFDIAFRRDPDGFKRLIKEWFNKKVERKGITNFWKDSLKVETDQAGAIAWLLEAMQKDPRFGGMGKMLKELKKGLYQSMNSTSEELSFEHLPYFAPLIEENEPKILERFKEAILEKDLSSIGSLDMLWLLEKNKIPDEDRNRFYDIFLDQVSSMQGWGKSDYAMTFHALDHMFGWLKDQKPEQIASRRKALNETIRKSNSPVFLAAASAIEDQYRTIINLVREAGADPEVLSKLEAIVPSEDVRVNRRLIAATYLANFKKDSQADISLLKSFFGRTESDLWKDSELANLRKIQVTQLIEPASRDRNSWGKKKRSTIETPEKSGPQLMDSFFGANVDYIFAKEKWVFDRQAKLKKDQFDFALDQVKISVLFDVMTLGLFLNKAPDALPKNGEYAQALKRLKQLVDSGNSELHLDGQKIVENLQTHVEK